MTMHVPLQFWLWTLIATCAFLTKAVQGKDIRIAGGGQVDFHEYPFQVALEYNTFHRCGAAILSKNWVVTAAHCLQNAEPENLRVRWGTPSRGIGGTVHQAVRLLPHHQYVFGSYDYDIALIKVSPDFAPNTSISLVDRNVELVEGKAVYVVGWGADSSGGWLSNTLQAVELSLVSRSYCQFEYQAIRDEVTPRMVCAAHYDSEPWTPYGPCTGDSGAPLVMDDMLLGVVSWSYGCNNDMSYPGVFTNVQSFQTWIEVFIGETPGNW